MNPARHQISPEEKHIASIYQEYTKPSRLLQSFTNLSNTVIQTALSGQTKFVFEILQNADDAFEDPRREIDVKFILHGNYFIVNHNGKGFDYNDVERICDYASQVEEVKAHDLRKTGYKGLGFKSLFNLSDTIYIHSNGYSFRFDKTFWPDWQNKPWQIIPIWCRYEELPFYMNYPYNRPVNIILKVNNANYLDAQLRELIVKPDLLLFMHRICKLDINLNGEICSLCRKKEISNPFDVISFYKNQQLESTWLSRTFDCKIPQDLIRLIRGRSKFIFPDKIKNAKSVLITCAVRSKESLETISEIKGLCYCTLPTQLYLTLPYHVNSSFILNLDRTQLHENEWNEFLIYQLGRLQLCLLADLAVLNSIKNYVLNFLVRGIDHPLAKFRHTFNNSYMDARGKIPWIPDHQDSRLLRLGETWIDEIEFFKQNFENIRDHQIYPFLLNYDLLNQRNLSSNEGEIKRFSYENLFADFELKYFPQLTKHSYCRFIKYLYDRLKNINPSHKICNKLKRVPLLMSKDKTLVIIHNSYLEEAENPLPDFLSLNPIDNDCLPADDIESIKNWLQRLGAKRLTPHQMFEESIWKWIESNTLKENVTERNHLEIIDFLAKNINLLTRRELEKLKEKLVVLTEDKKFKPAKYCYLPDAAPIPELREVILSSEKISLSYTTSLKEFFISVGVRETINLVDVFRNGIIKWIDNEKIIKKLTIDNYKPIIEFIATLYPKIEFELNDVEKSKLRSLPILTCEGKLHKAKDCLFEDAIPKVKGLEYIVSRARIASEENFSPSVLKFLEKIGVMTRMDPTQVLRRSVIKWIFEGQIYKQITLDNHDRILKYIHDNWSALNSGDKQKLKEFPILTKNNTFRKAAECFFPQTQRDEEIPGLESVISCDELVSENYDLRTMKHLLEDLGVRGIDFVNISYKYCDHLNKPEKIKWFFSKLLAYWKRSKSNSVQDILHGLHDKFYHSSRLLAKNGRMYLSAELYSSKFEIMHKLDYYAVPLLCHEKLPEDLENWLGFKRELELSCLEKLLKALDRNPEIGEKDTHIFFSTLLEQLKSKNKNDIKKHQFSLFNLDGKLKYAKDLYYFKEEEAMCHLKSFYLQRIAGMSHTETLQLAELCGVNVLPFHHKIIPSIEKIDESLRQFYLERLPFIVIQEAKRIHENICDTLKRLFDSVCSIELQQCKSLLVHYDFGTPVKIYHSFDQLAIFVVGNWMRKKSTIHPYLIRKLGIKSNLSDIFDMIRPDLEKDDWLDGDEEAVKNFKLIEEEIRRLIVKKQKEATNADSSSDEDDILSENDIKVLSSDESVSQTSEDEKDSVMQSDDENIDGVDKINSANSKTIKEEVKVELKVLIPKTINDVPKQVGQISDSESANSSSEEDSVEESEDEPNVILKVGTIRTPDISEEKDPLCERKLSSVSLRDVMSLIEPLEPRLREKISTVKPQIPKLNNTIDFPHLNPEVNEKSVSIKQLCEKYVFNHLQNHYRNKYPKARIESLSGTFTLKWEFLTIEIVWLNEKEDIGSPYDFILRKNGNVRWLIEVKSSDLKCSDSLSFTHSEFSKKETELEVESPRYKDKYCVYHVFNVDNTSAIILQELNNPTLYKVTKLEKNLDLEDDLL